MRRLLLSLVCSAISACALPDYDVDTLRNRPGDDAGAVEPHGDHGTAVGGGGSGPPAPRDGGPLAEDNEQPCIDYCDTFEQNCRDNPAYDYDGVEDCYLVCGNSDWPIGNGSTTNSIRCRQAHAVLAVTQHDPDLHCMHARSEPVPSCPPPPPP